MTRRIIEHAADLLTTAIEEEIQVDHRDRTVAAMAVALGVLRTLADTANQDTQDTATQDTEIPLDLSSVTDANGRLNWQHLADLVLARRNWLGMSQFDVTRAGGPSEQTLRRVEGTQRCSYERRTLTRLEQALGWPPNAIIEILAGAVTDHNALVVLPPAARKNLLPITARKKPAKGKP